MGLMDPPSSVLRPTDVQSLCQLRPGLVRPKAAGKLCFCAVPVTPVALAEDPRPALLQFFAVGAHSRRAISTALLCST